MRKHLVAALAAALIGAVHLGTARAQEPSGAKFRVNTYTTGYQYRQAVGAVPNGDFVVVWSSNQTYGGEYFDVFGQRYDSRGQPQGTEFRISETQVSRFGSSDVAASASGDFVVVWSRFVGQAVIMTRRLAADGTPQSGEVTIADGTYPSVARAPSGAYVVAWAGAGGSRGVVSMPPATPSESSS